MLYVELKSRGREKHVLTLNFQNGTVKTFVSFEKNFEAKIDNLQFIEIINGFVRT